MEAVFSNASLVNHIFEYVLSLSSKIHTSSFYVCKLWNTHLSSPLSSFLWKNLLLSHYPNFNFSLDGSDRKSFYQLLSILFIDHSFETKYDKNERNPRITTLITIIQQLTQDKNNKERIMLLVGNLFERLHNSQEHRHLYTNTLFYGPSGCKRTELIQETARAWGATLLTVKFQNLLKLPAASAIITYLNGFAKTLKTPCLIHISQITMPNEKYPSEKHSRNSRVAMDLVNVLLDDKYHAGNVWIIGTTSKPNTVSPSIARRLSQSIYLSLPSLQDREKLFFSQLSSKFMNSSLLEEHSNLLASHSTYFTTKELSSFCDEVNEVKEEWKEKLQNYPHKYNADQIDKLDNFDPRVLNARYLNGWGGFHDTTWDWDAYGRRVK